MVDSSTLSTLKAHSRLTTTAGALRMMLPTPPPKLTLSEAMLAKPNRPNTASTIQNTPLRSSRRPSKDRMWRNMAQAAFAGAEASATWRSSPK
ncbi:hypothetical protein [Pseudoxanthomonas sp. SGT-18]|uniref:hypothetical protein n=1 Tax=Pseudoxanthomonas sp. SGT-18 TaxID=2493087 RepID=UPI0013DDFE20